MNKVRMSDIDWPWWWPGSFNLAGMFWLFALYGLGCMFGVTQHPLDRLDALEARPPHVCEPVKALDTPPTNDDWSPENDAAIQYETWVRVPRKCGVGQQTTEEGR